MKAKLSIENFADWVWQEGKKRYRKFPWRQTRDPYKILVSEVMLQQTQVSRVLPKYRDFLHAFPNIESLAKASLKDVLWVWQGLGYNRRAKYLKVCAEVVVSKYASVMPQDAKILESLPGVGKATAAGVRAFAFGLPGVYLDTNVRTVFLDYFFPKKEAVSDAELIPLIEQSLPEKNIKGWYYALLDIGSFIKQTKVNPSRRSKHFTSQSRFLGSDRQIRGALIAFLLKKPATSAVLEKHLGFPKKRIEEQLAALLKEKLISVKKARFQIE